MGVYKSVINFKSVWVLLLSFSLLTISCSESPERFIEPLNGYWEIEKVTLANGEVKTYKYNETIDYIKINDSLKGFRKKLKPGINNTYFTSKDVEAITLSIEQGRLKIHYKTPYASWQETVIEATEDVLKLVNENKDVYTYKRYTSLELSIE